jgi:hypothetical protein
VLGSLTGVFWTEQAPCSSPLFDAALSSHFPGILLPFSVGVRLERGSLQIQ